MSGRRLETSVHVSEIIEGVLYQGSYLAPSYLRPPADLHIGCAVEYKPSRNSADHVLHIPLHDDPDIAWADDEGWVDMVTAASELCADTIESGKRVLVTCAAGLNRSGLVVGLTLCVLGYDPETTIHLVRKARGPLALSNPRFVEVIESLG